MENMQGTTAKHHEKPILARAANSFAVLASFCATTMFYVAHRPDTLITGVWPVPMLFVIVAAIIWQAHDTNTMIPAWLTRALSSLSLGVGSGFGMAAAYTLNQWYLHPDEGFWEPLSAAYGAAVAITFAARSAFESID
jgi:hypothetical protein